MEESSQQGCVKSAAVAGRDSASHQQASNSSSGADDVKLLALPHSQHSPPTTTASHNVFSRFLTLPRNTRTPLQHTRSSSSQPRTAGALSFRVTTQCSEPPKLLRLHKHNLLRQPFIHLPSPSLFALSLERPQLSPPRSQSPAWARKWPTMVRMPLASSPT